MTNLWNIGGKVRDLRAEHDFLVAAGADVRGLETIKSDGDDLEILDAELGGARLILMETTGYESRLGRALDIGWSHIVFEVDDLDDALDRLAAAGGRLVHGPAIVNASFSHRRMAFFESPGGCIYEVFAEIKST